MNYENSPVGQLVLERPARARVFEQRAIDYCCQGKKTLAQACEAGAIPLAAVIDELAASDANTDANSAAAPAALPTGPVELIRYILETHHAYLKAELPRLTELATKVQKAHGERHPELAAVVVACGELRADLEPHLLKEEQVLFPWILELASRGGPLPGRPPVQGPIEMMEFEHERVGEILAELRSATAGFVVPSDGCPTYHAFYEAMARLEADTHQHIHAENNLLFPMARRLEAGA